jgi:outer membrane receptor protein involved in Fe transport
MQPMTHPFPARFTPIAVALALAASGLQAQPEQAGEPGQADFEPVVVTGSRLRGALFDGAWPLTTIRREELVQSGASRLGDFLQQLPFTAGSPLNTQTSRRGRGGGLSRGIETVELRGLGEERTLVLVDGRRFVPGGNGASGVVDLGMLPVAMIERIEIFKSGASVEYGADALAGVVNVITRKGVDGAEITARARITSRGDGETGTVSAVAGRTFTGGDVMVGLEYTDQQPVSKGARGFSRTRLTLSGPDNAIAFDGSSAPPNGQYRTSFGRFTLIDGRDGDARSDFRPFINSGPDTDRFNFNPFEDLLQASERLGVFGRGQWFVGPDLRVFGQALFNRRESSQQLAPLPFFTTRLADVVVAADNRYNPFGEPLTDVRRRLVEGGPRTFAQDNTAWRFVAGLDGRLGGWFWDAAVTHGRNETDQTKTGDLLADRVRAALGPSFVDDAGNSVCGTPAMPRPDCVPLNLFGGPGSITPAMLDYVRADIDDFGYNEQTVVNGNITGEPLTLPAGALAIAAGFEWREESALDRPDPEVRAGNTTGNARALTRGEFDAAELYVELGVPLLAGAPLARSLTLDLGARAIDFSNFGSDSVVEAGLNWRITETLGVHGSYTEAFRAPNVGELFGGTRQANPIVEDPCADFAQLSPVEIDRCITQGVPADGSFAQTGEETPELSGGNPGLGPETADIVTAGLKWSPAALEAFTLSLDYYDIEIDNGIAALGADTVLAQCLATGADAFCDAIVRAPGGAIEFIRARLQNLARETARGIDLGLDWRHDSGIGTLDHRLLVSRIEERSLVAFPGAQPLFGAGGFDPDNFGAIPEWRARYGLRLTRGSWSFGYRAQFIGEVAERGGEVFAGTVNTAGPVVYHDIDARYVPTPRWRFSAGVDNVSDIEPPFFANADEANTDLATYRALGTTFWLRLEYRSAP